MNILSSFVIPVNTDPVYTQYPKFATTSPANELGPNAARASADTVLITMLHIEG